MDHAARRASSAPDWYDDGYFKDSPEIDPTGPSDGIYRVLHGGSWASNRTDCRPARRIKTSPGTTTPFHTGETISTDQANYNDERTYGAGKKGIYRMKTTPVSSFPANAWGLHDMHGNVWEWCQDRYGEEYYENSPRNDPTGPDDGVNRVLRGSSWKNVPGDCRSAYRDGLRPDHRTHGFGFRVVLRSAPRPPQ